VHVPSAVRDLAESPPPIAEGSSGGARRRRRYAPDVSAIGRDRLRERVLAPGAPVPGKLEDFLAQLGGPSLLRLPGRDGTRARALATLLHGNEPSGSRALHAWLRGGRTPAVDVLVFLGAPEAALGPPLFAHRMLPGRPDLNRCFLPPFADSREARVARELVETLRAASPEALVDLHNTTGHTPAYGVGPRPGERELALAALFAERFIHNDLRLGALVEACADAFPSVVVECGLAGAPESDRVAARGLEVFLEAERLPDRAPPGMAVHGGPVRVALRPGARVAYAAAPVDGADLTLLAVLDRHNFAAQPAGTLLGWLGRPGPLPLVATDGRGRDVTSELFASRDVRLTTSRALVPVMVTVDPEIAERDCLFYAVGPVPEPRRGSGPAPGVRRGRP
jgi:hypothetical protein